MIVSIYKYILYKLQRLVAGNYLDDLSAQVSQLHADKAVLVAAGKQYEEAVTMLNGVVQQLQTVAEEQSKKLLKTEQDLFSAESTVQHLEQNPREVWVMAPEVFKKFCAEFEPPVINQQNTPTDAAFRLGIQRVLSRIGERYVSR